MEDGYGSSFRHFLNFAEDDVLEKFLNSRPNADLLSSQSCEFGKGVASAPVDIKQSPKDYIFIADVPGLTKADIQVQVENGKLLIIKCAGKRKRDEGEEECKLLRVERKANNRFTRKFTLPGDAKADGISASCVDGVLSVTVPRFVPEKPKTIEVAVA